MQFHRPIHRVCRNLQHALRIAREWAEVPDQSVEEEETYGASFSFAAPTHITDHDGEPMVGRGKLWRML